MHPRLLLPALAVATVAQAQEPSPTYTVGPSGSHLYVVLRNDTSASLSRLGHDHVIYAKGFAAEVTWPTQPGGACSVSFSVPVRKLVVDPPGLRQRAGLDDNTIDDDDKQDLSKNMWGKSQLWADEHPQITFRSTSCPGGTGKVTVGGDLTIRGVAQPVSVELQVAADGKAFAASGALTITHTQFDFKPFAASLFGPRNQDELKLVVDVKGAVAGS
ncbi:MAG: YceI family protein [Alphaproteobacteria bacterium]|nr:YceI family protein [Alphaproteobacteria bacterium]